MADDAPSKAVYIYNNFVKDKTQSQTLSGRTRARSPQHTSPANIRNGKTKDGLFVLTSSFSFVSLREHHSKQNTRSTHDLLCLIANKHVSILHSNIYIYIYINRCILFICRYISGGIFFDETGCPLHRFGIVIRCSSTQLASMLSLYAIVCWSIHA